MEERNEVVDQHYRTNYDRLVFRYSRTFDPDSKPPAPEAEDAVQEAYARALKYWDSFNPVTSKFTTWFGTILLNTVRDILAEMMEKGSVQVKPAMLQLVPTMGQKLRAEELLDLVSQQKPELRDALYLTLVLGHTYGEAAELHPASAKAIAKMVERFRATL